MAAAAAVEVKQEEYDVCSVCRDSSTRDPRLLDCGHHFCKCCLEKLAIEKTITCPTCRYITQVNTGVEGLAWYRTTNPFTDKVTQATKAIENNELTGQIQCDACTVDVKGATKTCPECQFNFCNTCGIKHGVLEENLSHKLYPISPYMVCEQHNRKQVKFACLSCKTVCCTVCIIEDHNAHQVENIQTSGEQARTHLQEVRKNLMKAKEDDQLTENIQKILGKAKQVRQTFHSSIKDIKTALADLSATVDKVSEEVNTKMAATIKTLEMMTSDIGDYMTSKTSLRELLTYLIEGASSPEVVVREKELPKYDKTTYKQVVREPEVEIAELGDTLSEIIEKLDKCQQDLDIAFTKHSVCVPEYDTTPLSNLQRSGTIQAGNLSDDLCI